MLYNAFPKLAHTVANCLSCEEEVKYWGKWSHPKNVKLKDASATTGHMPEENILPCYLSKGYMYEKQLAVTHTDLQFSKAKCHGNILIPQMSQG